MLRFVMKPKRIIFFALLCFLTIASLFSSDIYRMNETDEWGEPTGNSIICIIDEFAKITKNNGKDDIIIATLGIYPHKKAIKIAFFNFKGEGYSIYINSLKYRNERKETYNLAFSQHYLNSCELINYSQTLLRILSSNSLRFLIKTHNNDTIDFTFDYDKTELNEILKEKDSSFYMLGDTVVFSKDIETNVLANRRDIKNIRIENGVTSIGDSAFKGCTGLTRLEIPTSVTKIGDSAFEGCTGLSNIEIPSSVTSIGESAFSGCTGLTSIEIPNSVTSIGARAFSGCTSLRKIYIPNSVTYIGRGAFSRCTRLTSIEIPNSVTSIDVYAFYRCTSLMSLEIPDSVKSIEESAFSDCTKLLSIEIPDGVTSIGARAFSGCTWLQSIEVPKSVISIGNQAFAGCTHLTTVRIPRTTKLGEDVFPKKVKIKYY